MSSFPNAAVPQPGSPTDHFAVGPSLPVSVTALQQAALGTVAAAPSCPQVCKLLLHFLQFGGCPNWPSSFHV